MRVPFQTLTGYGRGCRRPLAVVGLACALLSQPASASQEQLHAEMIEVLEAYAVHKMGQYDKAFARWMVLAEKGNAQGILNVANFYQEGTGVEKDPAEAVRWYRKGAEQGDPHCLFNLGRAYEAGLGVPADKETSDAYYERAAEVGSTDAQLIIARSLLEANSEDEARRWLERAAASGDQDAIALLARLAPADANSVSGLEADQQRRIRELLDGLDAAANARDVDLLTRAIDEEAEILVRLPGQSSPERMSKDAYKALWAATFDKTERYRFARTQFDSGHAGPDVRVRSTIREYLTSDNRTQLLVLREDLTVSLAGDAPRVTRVVLAVENG